MKIYNLLSKARIKVGCLLGGMGEPRRTRGDPSLLTHLEQKPYRLLRFGFGTLRTLVEFIYSQSVADTGDQWPERIWGPGLGGKDNPRALLTGGKSKSGTFITLRI